MMTYRSKQISILVAIVMALFCIYGFVSVALAQDMVIEKTVIPTTPVQPGDTLTYTITFTNQQGAPATGIMITDTIPVSLTNLNVISSGVSITRMSGLTYTWQVADMSAGDVGVITVTGKIKPALPADNIVNNVTITASNEITLNQETDSATISVAEVSGLSIKKEAPQFAAINKPFSYTITVVNNGPYTATNVIVTDTLPTGVISSLTNISASQGSCNLSAGGVVHCTLGSLNSPELLVSQGGGNVSRYSMVDGHLLGNIVVGSQPRGLAFGPDGHLYVAQSTGSNSVVVCKDIYTPLPCIPFLSSGLGNPEGVAFGPNGNLYVNAYSGNRIFYFNGTTGAPVDGAGSFASAPSRPVDLMFGPDNKLYVATESGNRVRRYNLDGSIDVTFSSAAGPWGIDFDADNNLYVTAYYGSALQFSNNIAAGGTLTTIANPNKPGDVLVGGDGYLYVSGYDNGTVTRYDGSTLIDTFVSGLSNPLYMILNTSRGAEATIVITVTPQVKGVLNNTAVVTSDQADPTVSDNTNTATTTVSGDVDLQIGKIASSNTALAGEALTYTLTFTNNATDYAVGVVITDRLPTGVRLTSWRSSQTTVNCSLLSNLVTCQTQILTPNASSTIQLGTVISSTLTNGLITNTTGITSQLSDTDLSNNGADTTVTVNTQADLALSKVDFIDPVVAGDILTYSVVLTNLGPSDATNVILTDTLPFSISSVISKTSTGVTCTGDDTAFSCNFGTVSLAPLVSRYFDASTEGWTVVTNTNTSPTYSASAGHPNSHIMVKDDLNTFFFFNAPASYLGNQSLAYEGTLKFDLRGDYINVANINAGEIFLKGGGLTLRYCLDSNCGATTAWASRDWTSRSIVLAETDTNWHKNEMTFPAPTAAEFQQVLANLTAIQIRGDLGSGIGDFGHLDNVELLPGPVRTTITVTVGSTITPNTVITNSVEVRSTTPDLDTANNVATETTLVVGEVDLSLSKIESADPINAGDILTYTLTISNAGPSAAQAVVVTDTLPMNVTVTYSATSLGNGCDVPVGGVISCSLSVVDTVTKSGSAVITLAVLLDTDILSGTILTNTAGLTVTSSQTELNLTNNSLTTPVTTTVSSEANLIIRKLDDPDPVTTNRPLTYTIVITNAGPSDALNVVLTDTLMGAATVLSSATFSGTPCTVLGPPTVCNLGTLTRSSRATVTILLRPTAEGVITNVVTATTTTFDSTTPNTASITTTVYGEVALTLTKSVDNPSPALGQRLTYTMILSNGGTTNATSVVLSDTLPSGLTFVPNSIAVQPNQAGLALAAPPQVQLVSGLTITHGERITVTFGITVGATLNNGDTVINTAAITSVQPSGAIPVTDSVSFTIDNQVDLEISKTVTPTVASLPGGRITYTLRFTNSGAGLATGVVITDLVPISVTAVSLGFSFGGDVVVTDTAATPRYVFEVSDMAAGEVGLITITGQLSSPLASGRFTNTATITTTTVDTDANNNLASASVEVTSLLISEIMYNSGPTASVDEPLWEWVELYNAGPTPLDLAGYVFYDSNSPVLAAANITAGSIPSGGSAVLFNGESNNLADFLSAWGKDVNAVAVTDWPTDLANGGEPIAIWSSISRYQAGFAQAVDVVTYDSGSGWPVTANGQSIYLTDLSADNNVGSHWDLSDVGDNTPAFITYRGGYSVTEVGSPGPSADLVISKQVQPTTVLVSGQRLTYTLRFSNTGSYTATGIVITDIVPSELSSPVFTPSTGVTVTPTGGSNYAWQVADLAPNQAGSITITGLIANGIAPTTFTNTALITSTTFDTLTSNNRSTVTSTVEKRIDLAIQKTVNPSVAAPGERITYTIVFTNNEGDTATDVVITDVAPISLTNRSVVSSGVAITDTAATPAYVWQVADLAAGAGGVITLSGVLSNPLTNGIFTNTAMISTTTAQTETDTSNNIARVPLNVSGSPELTLSKTVDPLTNAVYHGPVTYTVQLSNSGAVNATSVRLTDSLPISTTFSRWLTQPSGANFVGNQLRWTGVVTGRESLTFRFVVSHTGNGYGEVINNIAQFELAGVVTPSNEAVFTITRQPLAVDDSYTTAEDSPLTIAASGVLTNDSDPDGDSLTAAVVVSPTRASSFAFNSSGGFTYFPAGNFAGQDVFTYTVSDGRGGVATATVTINITPTNDAPLIGRNFVLYDGGKGVIPAVSPPITSGLVYTEPTDTVVQTQAGGVVTVDSGNSPKIGVPPLFLSAEDFYAGYGGNPAFYPTPLNHNNGYTLKFSVRVNSESHDRPDRAGFSVIAVSANTTKAIELGFWTDRIFAQEGGNGPTLFTQAEHATFNTTTMVDYELTVLGDSYILTANGADVLSGTMRDYTAFTPSASLPVDPYDRPNTIFLGDDTTSARGQFSIGYVSVIVPESSPLNPLPDYTTVANTNLSIDSVGAIDFDAGGNNVVLTMTVNNGQLNVSNTADLAGISGNGSDTLIMTGTLRAINNALGVTQTLRYRSNPGFMGTDTVTVRLNDRGFTGGGVLTDTASFNINVLGPVLTMTKVVDDAAPIPGQRITYTLVLSNGGNYTATSGLLSDTLPTGLTFAAAQIEPSGAGTVGSPTNLATNLIISPNRLITVTAQFTVNANLPHGTVITNSAALSSAEVITPVRATALLTVTNEVDLQVSKQVITRSNPVKPGDTVTYTISFSNVGKGLAQGIVITDVVPSLLTSVSIQTDTTLAMTRTGATTAAWQVADMLNDTSGVITISGVISPLLSTATRFTNTVRLTSTTVQSQTSNDVAAVGLMVQVPALTMSKTMDDNTPSPGQTVTYTIVLSNGGGAPITGATLSDTLPISLPFVGGSVNILPNSAGTVGSPPNLATGLTIAANSAVTVTVQGRLINQAVDGQHITNTASVSATALPAAITASVVATVSNQADLLISKTVTPSGPVKPGERITYTLSFTNNGPGVAQSVRISDTLPTDLSGLSYQPSGVSVTATGSISYAWQVADLLVNQGGSIQVSGQISTAISSDRRLTNTVEISTTTPDNGGSVYTATVGLDVAVPTLTMSKQSAFTGATLLPGQTITYSIIVTNSGSITVTSGTISDTVPANTTYVGGSIAGGSSRSDATAPTLSWTVSNVAPTAVETLIFQVTVANSAVSGTQIINQATLTSSEIMTPLADMVTDTVILPVADIALSKTRLGSGDVLAGGLITYALRITNSGPNAVNRVLITDTFIGGVTNAAPTASSGSCSGSGPIVCQVDNFTGSETITVVLTTNANFSGTLTNTAEITFAAGTFASDNNPGDTRDSVLTTVRFPQTDLQISKARVGSGDVIAGQPITYTLRITNAGPDVVSQLVVTDTVSGMGAALSGNLTPSTGSCTAGVCTFANFTGTATITAVVNTSSSYSGTVTNTAVITFGNGVTATEIAPSNESDSVTTTVRFPQTDLQISKARVGSGDVIAGQPITYTLRITNAGPDVVSQIVVTDTVSGTGAALSGNLTPSTGSCTAGVCTFANFTGTATITAVVNTSSSYSGTVTNTAVITFGNGVTATETTPGDEQSAVLTTVRFPQTDLQISKARVGSGDVIAGQPITYTLRITNAGPDVVSQIVVTDTVSGTGAALSGNLTPSTGSCTAGVCTFANFTGTATITAVVNTSGSYSGTVTNTAVITFGNGVTATEIASGNENDSVLTTVRFPQTDLQISKVRVGSGDVLPGQSVTFTLRITNVGPDVPSQIVVTDRFTQTTAGLISSVSSQRSDGGSCTTGASPLTCQFSNLTNTQTITFVFNSSSSVSGLVSNTAEITFASGVVAADTNLANNGPTTVVTALIAGTDLSVSKSVNDSTPFENQQIVYTIRVDNNGPDAATGVVISDALPTGVTHVANNGGGAYNFGSGAWKVPGTLANGSSATLLVTATVNAGTKGNTITNTATLNTVSPQDLNAANNSADAPITVEIPTVSFIAPASINETGGSRIVQVQVNVTDTANITVDYAVSGGSATNGTDYGLTAGTLTFPPGGPLVQTFTVFITDDAIFEGNETINLQLSNVSGNAQIGTANTTLTIVDNEVPPNAAPVGNADVYTTTAGLTLTVAAAGVLGNDTDANGDSLTAQLVVNVTHGTLTLSANGSFVYRPNAGFAGSDSFRYRANDGKTNSGLTTVTINVTNESPTANDDSYTLVQDTVLTVTAAGVLANDSDSDGHPLTATLSSGPSNGSLTVSSNGAFTYTPTSGFIGTDSFTYTVSDGYGGVATATVKLVVSLDPPQVGFTQATQTVMETVGTTSLVVTLSKVSAVTVTVDYAINPDTAVANDDYLAMNGSLTFPPGTLMQTIPLTIVDDLINEASEQLTVRLQNGVNGVVQPTNNPTTVVITDNDPLPTVLFDAPTYQVDEDAGNVTVTVTLNAPSGQPITVTVMTTNGTAIAPADYTAVSSTLTFSPGVTQVTVVIPILNDGLSEGEESFTVGLTDADGATVGAPSSATVTIIDTSRPTVQFATAGYSINENGGQATIMVTLNQTSSLAVTVAYASADGTATAGNDYTAVSGVLTFPAGSLMQMFSVPITDDTLTEPNETVNLQLSNPTHALSGTLMAAVLTIRDNEVVTLTSLVATNDSPTSLGQPTQFTATVTPASNVTYTWQFGDGSTGSGQNPTHVYPTAGVYTAVVTASNSINLLTATTVVTVNSEDIEITGLTIISEETILTFEGTFFTATVTSGTNINYVWNLGDGTIISNGAIIGHTYTTVATYTVVVTASNSVSRIVETTTVTVYDFVKYLDRADIGVIKTVSSSPAVINTLLTYTLIVSNSGPNTARDVILTDTLPTNVQIVTLPSNCQNQGNIVCMLGDIANKQTITLTLGVSPTVVGTLVNQVAASIDQMDPDLLNNTFELPLAVGHAKVTLEPSMNSTVVYTKPTNLTATQITVPAGAVTEPLVLLLTELDSVQNLPDGVESAGLAFTVDLYQNGQVVVGRTLTDPVTMTLSYPADVSPDQLQLLYWNGSQWVDAATTCQPPASYVFDPTMKQVSLSVCDTVGQFAWVQQSKPKPPTLYLPIIINQKPPVAPVYLPIILHGGDNRPLTSTPVTPDPTAVTTPVATPTSATPNQPDLSVRVSLSPDKQAFSADEAVIISVVVTNQGQQTVTKSFWVDLFINPKTPPTDGRRIWNENCSLTPCYGMAWQVTADLAPGESVTLLSTNDSFSPPHTTWPGKFAAGTTSVYVYVDTWTPSRGPDGAILESNESNNRAAVTGLSVTGSRQADESPTAMPQFPPRWLAEE